MFCFIKVLYQGPVLPFSTASASGRTAVVEEDSDEDEEETEDDGQD